MEKKRSSIALPVISGILLLGVVALLVWAVMAQPKETGPGSPIAQSGNREGGAPVEETFQDVYALYVEAGSVNIRVTASGDDAVHVRYPSSLEVDSEHDRGSGVLSLYAEDEPFGLFSFRIGYPPEEIEIAVPELYAVELNARSGNVNITGVRADSLSVSTQSGNIDAGQLNVESYIVLDATSGNVTCVHFYTASIAAGATSGNVRLEQAYASEITLNSASGNQTLRAEMGALAYCYANSGNVDIECREPLEGWVRTTSGDVKMRMPYDPQKVTYSTNSGNAKAENSAISVSKDAVYSDLYIFETESGGPTLEIFTTSGNLRLR